MMSDIPISLSVSASDRQCPFDSAKQQIDSALTLCNEFIAAETDIQKQDLDRVLDMTVGFASKYSEEKRKLPYHINLIDELHAGENAHSRILVKLLQYETDGKYPILESFLEYLFTQVDGIHFEHKIKRPKITAEDLRIDALIRDKDYAVIIENKINWAPDQPRQIQNYIDKLKKEHIDEEHIYILYLTREGGAPSEDSLPNGLRESFATRFKAISYRNEILDWLKRDVVQLHNREQEYLSSALCQYIDHLKGLFQLRTIEIPMKYELSKHLEEKLGLDKDPSENVRIINEKLKDIDMVKGYMEELLSKNYICYWAGNISKEFDGYLPTNKSDKLEGKPIVGFIVNHNGMAFRLVVEIDFVKRWLYLGIATFNEETHCNKETAAFLEEFLVGFRRQDFWYGWKWYGWNDSDYSSVYRDFQTLAHKVIAKINSGPLKISAPATQV